MTGEDLTGVSRLLRDGARRFYAMSGADLPGHLAGGYGVALDSAGDLYAIAMVSLPIEGSAWLRAVAVAEGVDVRAALATLIPALHTVLRARGVREIYFAGDESAEQWLVPSLRPQGYVTSTEVVVYEKTHLDVPDLGNLDVQVRQANYVDLPGVLALDRVCFEPQWTKDDAVLGPAINQGPYFVVAERDGELLGYAYATAHFSGRLVHLVRIAVDPGHRGARVGVRLMADLVAFASQLNASTLTLNTQAYNTGAQRLYRWFGFAPTGERQSVLCAALSSDEHDRSDTHA